jgi:hypothetical protein
LMDEHNHVIKKIIGRNKNFLTMRYKLIWNQKGCINFESKYVYPID